MNGGWASDWAGRIRTIGEGLFYIEVNTIEKASMSAQKMPDAPLALHAIIDSYSSYLTELGYAVDSPLYKMASDRIALPVGTPATDEKRLTDALGQWHPSSEPQPELTNGPETFEALQWAARAAARDVPKPRDIETPGILARIVANSRQLREASILLMRDHPSDAQKQPLFGVTIEAAVRALLNNPLPPLFVRPDVLVLIRKIWDVGTETVLMQSTMHIDGDLTVRVSPQLPEAKREFYAALHNGYMRTSVGQWQNLFNLIRELAGDLGKAIWGIV